MNKCGNYGHEKLNLGPIYQPFLTPLPASKVDSLKKLRQLSGEVSGICELETEAMSMLVGVEPGPEVIKLFSSSTQLSMKFSPLIHVKMPTIVGILTCMSGKNNILGLSEP